MPQRAFVEEFQDYSEWTMAVQSMVTEDDKPVENSFVEKQMRLLVESLYASWQPAPFEDAPSEKRSFWAAANVGVFASPFFPAIVPDVFLSLDVTAPEGDFTEKENRSYCLWNYDGKAPDVVIELISDKRGKEFDEKMESYGRMKVDYYITFDPLERYEEPFLRVYERTFAWRYRLREDFSLSNIGLKLVLWQGEYKGMSANWLRWTDKNGNLLLTGLERASVEAEARRQAEAEIERLRAELAQLRGTS
jgi:Uma2 family endonuclease